MLRRATGRSSQEWSFGGNEGEQASPSGPAGQERLGAPMNKRIPQGLQGALPTDWEPILEWQGRAPGRQDVVGQRAQPSRHLQGLGVVQAWLALVLVEDTVQRPVVRILDAPVQAHQAQQVLEGQVLGGQAGNEVAPLHLGQLPWLQVRLAYAQQ